MADIRIRVPVQAARGEVVEIKTLAMAPALDDPSREFGLDGLPTPHYTRFIATFAGQPVIDIDLQPGVSRNVMLSFLVRVEAAGILTLRWTRRDGGTEVREAAIAIG